MSDMNFISAGDVKILEEFHRAVSDKRTADKIKALLAANDGQPYSLIKKILLIDERTIKRYKKVYLNDGVEGITTNNYQGKEPLLSQAQQEELCGELQKNIYATADEIAAWVKKKSGSHYSRDGIVKLLHRLGYSYKKTTPLPGKYDRQAQQEFLGKWEKRLKKPRKDHKVYYFDGCHPTYNNKSGYAWIKQGEQRTIQTNTGRERINLLGAYDAHNRRTVVKDYPTVNSHSIVDFLKLLKQRNPHTKIIHLVLDNAPYNVANRVKDYAKKNKINLIYLPPHSPNLNLIERLWGLLKKKVHTNQYYPTFSRFYEQTMAFFKQRGSPFKKMLADYIPLKFHLLT